MRGYQLLVSLKELHSHKFEAFLLKALDDRADQFSLDTIGLDHDVGLLARRFDFGRVVLLATFVRDRRRRHFGCVSTGSKPAEKITEQMIR